MDRKIFDEMNDVGKRLWGAFVFKNGHKKSIFEFNKKLSLNGQIRLA